MRGRIFRAARAGMREAIPLFVDRSFQMASREMGTLFRQVSQAGKQLMKEHYPDVLKVAKEMNQIIKRELKDNPALEQFRRDFITERLTGEEVKEKLDALYQSMGVFLDEPTLEKAANMAMKMFSVAKFVSDSVPLGSPLTHVTKLLVREQTAEMKEQIKGDLTALVDKAMDSIMAREDFGNSRHFDKDISLQQPLPQPLPDPIRQPLPQPLQQPMERAQPKDPEQPRMMISRAAEASRYMKMEGSVKNYIDSIPKNDRSFSEGQESARSPSARSDTQTVTPVSAGQSSGSGKSLAAVVTDATAAMIAKVANDPVFKALGRTEPANLSLNAGLENLGSKNRV